MSVREGYGEWAKTYEDTVPDLLDLKILDSITSVSWGSVRYCLDLACGTGRTGQWLKSKEVEILDGLDLTPDMITYARRRNIYRTLEIGTVEDIKLTEKYDLIVMCLADEHLDNLDRVYEESMRVSADRAHFVVVGMHPFFFMKGMPTHFDSASGEPKAIETHVHLMSDHFKAATRAGWKLQEVKEGVIDDDWIKVKPKWEKDRGCPVHFGYVWAR